MESPWNLDARKLSDEVMNSLRLIAVGAVVERGYSPEQVIDMLGLSRSCIYTWLKRFREEGMAGLESKQAPGREARLTEEMDAWLRETVLNTTPVTYGFDTVLWTREILALLLEEQFGVKVSGRTVSLHLRKLGLSYQKPRYRAVEQRADEVAFFLNDTFPRIQRVAEKLGAEIAFEDEAGVGLRTHSGRTWGLQGHTPTVTVTDQRGGYNVLSIVTAEGELRYSLAEHTIQSERYIDFLKQLLHGRQCPLILIADRVSFHRSKAVRDFVRAHRHQLRVFFLPRHSPELNPDEQVWHEIKDNRIGKQPVKNKPDLKKRLRAALASLQHDTQRVISFFHLPDTQYAAVDV